MRVGWGGVRLCGRQPVVRGFHACDRGVDDGVRGSLARAVGVLQEEIMGMVNLDKES